MSNVDASNTTRVGLSIAPTTISSGLPFNVIGRVLAPTALPGFGGSDSSIVRLSNIQIKAIRRHGMLRERLSVSVTLDVEISVAFLVLIKVG